MRYKRLDIRRIAMIISVIVLVYTLIYGNVAGMFLKVIKSKIYNAANGMLEEHFSHYVITKEKESFKQIIIDEINGQMYAIDYLYHEGQKQSLVDKEPEYLIDFTVNLKEENIEEAESEKEEVTESLEAIEVFAPSVPADSVTYSVAQLADFDFLMSQMYIVPERALVLKEDLVAGEMLERDMTIKSDNSKPQILVYHTHSQEAFADSVEGEGMTIVEVGDYLTELLREKGFNVIHCTDSFDVDDNGNLDRSNAYVNALPAVQKILEENPSIEVVLDIHRDGLPDNVGKMVTEINGKQTAKIMFFNGVSRSSATGEIEHLYNPYRSNNLALSFQAKLKAMEYYPDFTRKNYIDAYQYNQHVIDKAMLIEVGAQNNDFIEAKNAMEPLSEILYMLFSEEG